MDKSIFLMILWTIAGLVPLAKGDPLQVRDGRGRLLQLPGAPQRIVSASLASDEILQELLPAKEGRLIAVSKFATDPTYSSSAASIRKRHLKTFGTELESLLSLKPDVVVLASYNRPDFVKKVEAIGIRTFVLTKFDSLADVKANITALGQLVGKSQLAKALIERAFAPLAQMKAPINGKKTVLAFSENMVLASSDTMFDSLCRAAGVTNVASQLGLKGWAKISEEVLVTLNPDYLIIDQPPGLNAEEAQARAIAHPAFGKLPAVKRGRFIMVPSALLTSVSHYTVKAVALIHHGAYGK